jgi:hypothetical protein
MGDWGHWGHDPQASKMLGAEPLNSNFLALKMAACIKIDESDDSVRIRCVQPTTGRASQHRPLSSASWPPDGSQSTLTTATPPLLATI